MSESVRHAAANTRSTQLFNRAVKVTPGGVNSPVRAFNAVGGTPRFLDRGAGSTVWDVDGNEYTDYVMSWGPLIHGHAFAPVIRALNDAARSGTSFGAPTEREVHLAETVVEAVPTVEQVRFVSSGTEATMSAVRLARAFTGRDLIVKFSGNYHGHADALLAQAGSGGLTLGVPTSPGVPENAARSTIVATYNDVSSLEAVFASHGESIAAIIVEPVAGNMGVVAPTAAFVDALKHLPQANGALLICDEVITGFRVGLGGAQQLLGLTPDLTTLGKILGGGLPVGAYGGREEIMSQISPSGPVYQAGTLSGNPLAMAAGLASLEPLKDAGLYTRLTRMTNRLAEGLARVAQTMGVPVQVNAVTGMFTMFFSDHPVSTLTDVQRCDTRTYARFFHAMLHVGQYLPPSQFEAWMLSTQHTDAVIDRTLQCAEKAFASIAQ